MILGHPFFLEPEPPLALSNWYRPRRARDPMTEMLSGDRRYPCENASSALTSPAIRGGTPDYVGRARPCTHARLPTRGKHVRYCAYIQGAHVEG